MRPIRTYGDFTRWWLIALTPGAAVVLYAMIGALWEPLLGGAGTSYGCSPHERPMDVVMVVAVLCGLAAAILGAYWAWRGPRLLGAMVLSSGLLMIGGALLVAYVAATADIPPVCND